MTASFSDVLGIMADTFCGGSETVAGLVVVTVLLLLLFALVRNTQTAAIISIPLVFACTLLGILETSVMLLLMIVAVLFLAASNKRWISKRPRRRRT